MASAAASRLDPRTTISLAPLGVPLEIELLGSDDARMLAGACRRWEGSPTGAAPRLRLRIEASERGQIAGAVRITIDDGIMRLRGDGVDGAADPASGFASCRVAPGYLARPELLRSEILDPLVLYLLNRTDRAPVHASCLVVDGLAVLLAGPSGSGKSCLALAADAAGYAVLSEDIAYVQLRPRLTIWGWPGPVHLLPANAPARPFATRVRNGKTKLAVPLRATDTPAASATSATFCLLRRGDAVALERLAPEEALQSLAHLEPGFDVVAAEVRAAHAALTRNGAWRLTLSADPAEAIRFIAANIARLHATAVP